MGHSLPQSDGPAQLRFAAEFYSLRGPLFANLKRLVAWHDTSGGNVELEQISKEAREAVSVAI